MIPTQFTLCPDSETIIACYAPETGCLHDTACVDIPPFWFPRRAYINVHISARGETDMIPTQFTLCHDSGTTVTGKCSGDWAVRTTLHDIGLHVYIWPRRESRCSRCLLHWSPRWSLMKTAAICTSAFALSQNLASVYIFAVLSPRFFGTLPAFPFNCVRVHIVQAFLHCRGRKCFWWIFFRALK